MPQPPGVLKRIAAAALLGAAVLAGALAPPARADGIYSCVDSNGRRLTSDRPIPECSNREQRVLNRDGSVQRTVPPSMTADERAEYDARQAQVAAERRSQQDVLRRDRNLVARYPNEAAHAQARAAALDDVRDAVHASEERLKALAAERKPLLSEAEFYVGRQMPAQLKQQLDANDATTEAQRTLMQNQQAEIVRISATFDAELARLRKLWAGAAPGTLGPIEAPASAAPAPAPRAAAPAASTPKR